MGCLQWYDYNHPVIIVVLWIMAHIIKYKDMVKVEKISPQQAQYSF